MARKLSSRKNNKSKSRIRSKSKHHGKSKNKKSIKQKTQKKNNSTNKHRKTLKRQTGGYSDCNIATVQEAGFNVPSIGDIAGLNISSGNAVIYNPNCKRDTYQAMTP